MRECDVAISSAPLSLANAREHFERIAQRIPEAPNLEGSGVVICAGGPFVPSAYVVVRLLRDFGSMLPIEIWHAGADEIPAWAVHAFAPFGVTFHDVTVFYPDRPQKEFRGFPIKPAALTSSKLRHTLFLDADCFPLLNPEFLFASHEYEATGAMFWPDNKHYKMVEDGAIWGLTGLDYRGDPEFDTGIFAIDKRRCWRELCLAQWMNANSRFWYDYVMGDKDTFYVAWRKLNAPYFVGPPCRRFSALITRHFWKDGTPVVDHRCGTSKYALPRWGVHLSPYQLRPTIKNIYDELMQRFVVRNFRRHVRYLRDLKAASGA
jgi:hypothetical protein